MRCRGKGRAKLGRSSCNRNRKGKKRVGEEESLEKEKRGNVRKLVDEKEEQEGARRGGKMGEQRGLMIFSRLGPKSPTRVGRPDQGVLSKWMDTVAIAVARCAMLFSPKGRSLSKSPML